MTFWQHRLRKQRLGLWSTLFVFLLQSLAWSGMPVHATNVDQGWVVVCTSEGIKRVALTATGIAAGDSPQNDPLPTLAIHCDLCVFAKGLGTTSDVIPLLETYARGPLSRIHIHEQGIPSKPYTPQQPRAPPALSLI